MFARLMSSLTLDIMFRFYAVVWNCAKRTTIIMEVFSDLVPTMRFTVKLIRCILRCTSIRCSNVLSSFEYIGILEFITDNQPNVVCR